MRKLRYIHTLTMLCFSLNVIGEGIAANEDLYFAEISVKDGLSQGIVYSMIKDSKGFMWFGTGDGINRYDGYEFYIFKHKEGDPGSISNNHINCIAEDKDGYIWIGTSFGLNRFDPSTESFHPYLHDTSDKESLSSSYVKSILIDSKERMWIGTDGGLNLYLGDGKFKHFDFSYLLHGTRLYGLLEDSEGTIWIATRDSGMIAFDPADGKIRHFHTNAPEGHRTSSDHVYSLFEDSAGRIWAGTWEDGINIYDKHTDRIKTIKVSSQHNSLNNNQIRCFSEDRHGRIWIGTSEGLNIYDPSTDSFSYFLRHNNTVKALSNNTINCIYTDGGDAIWIGTNGGGINLNHPALDQFRLIDPKTMANHDYGYIGPMTEHDGKIWIGTEGGGLASYDIRTRKYMVYQNTGKSVNKNTIKSLCADSRGMLWVGTYAAGLFIFDPTTEQFEKHFDKSSGIMNSIINEIEEDIQGNIWVGTNDTEGLYMKTREDSSFKAMHSPWVRSIYKRNNGDLWIGSMDQGLFLFRNNRVIKSISVENSDLSSDSISAILEDSNGRVWIGTYGGGVNIYNPEDDSITVIDKKSGLLNDNVCYIIEDSLSTIWISTMAGLTAHAPDGNLTNYCWSKGNFPIETINLKSGLYASDGNIYFGGSNGIAYFSPEKIHANKEIPPVVITELTVDNQTIRPDDETGILKKAIKYTHDIVLSYKQTDISIGFSALNYIYPQNNQYSYILEGYDDVWSPASHSRVANYTNLPDGNYVFRVKGSNDCGVWNQEGVALNIRVLPPFWRTWWAYCIYVILTVGLITIVALYTLARMKLKNDIHISRLEKIAMEETHKIQLNLFTNFSHELRTPLTLVMDPLKNILQNETLSVDLRNSLELIHSNAHRILLIVNQLLDFRKHESGQMHLKIKEEDLGRFTREMVIIFRELTTPKNIRLYFHCPHNAEIINRFDPFLMEKVFFNLMSNAVKNTPPQGLIQVGIGIRSKTKAEKDIARLTCRKPAPANRYIYITIYNSGESIPTDELEKIFAPFYSIENKSNTNAYGTGLGLALAKNIIELHSGCIYAENSSAGGVAFRVILPCGLEMFPDEMVAKTEDSSASYKLNSNTLIKLQKENSWKRQPLQDRRKRHAVLIVDDNPEIRSYISGCLDDKYDIYEAENGQRGLEISLHNKPDLIISDIMMPVMDGLALSKEIKNNSVTSHIPVILLTARATIIQAQEGLKSGADDYITKPFDSILLKSKVDSIIENRIRLKESYIKNFNLELPNRNIGNSDQIFLTSAYEYVKENIGNSELSIEEFGKTMHISRSQLYRRIKILTDMSPSVFVCTLRLKVAAQLLAETNLNISEVAYKVGFNTPSYFTTSFKKLYGISPKEYKDNSKV